MGVGEDTGGVDDGGTFAVVGGDGGLKSVKHLSRLILTLVEVAEVDVGFRSFAGEGRTGEFGFGSGEVFFLLGNEGEQAVGFGGEVRLHSGRERSCFVKSASNQRGGFNVKLAEVAHGADVVRIELNCFLPELLGLFGFREIRARRTNHVLVPDDAAQVAVCRRILRIEFQCAPKFDKGFVVTVDKIKFLP